MVRILFALLLLQVSCFSEEGVYRNLEKRVKYFNSANFEGIEFNRLYIRELEYIRKGDFGVLEGSETIPTYLYTDYLYIYDNGKVLFFASEKPNPKVNLYRGTFDGILYRKKNQMFIDWIVKTKMNLGFGTYNSHKIKVINGKIHMQFDRYCYVYRPL